MAERGATPPVLDVVADQPRVADFLARALSSGRLGQAYLFCGAPGSGTREAAVAVAQALVCPHGGCGVCEECGRVAHGTHPDVAFLAPDSATGYRAEQVRDVVMRAQRTPVRAPSKLFVLEDAEQLRGVAANALLKTVEEPPADTRFILLAPAADRVLPTLVSRCQVVPFSPAGPAAAAARLSAKTGRPPALAAAALSVCPVPSEAEAFLGSEARQEVRRRAIAVLGRLDGLDSWGVVRAADDLVEAELAAWDPDPDGSERIPDQVREDFLSRGAVKALEQQEKREKSARERSGIMELVAVCDSVLRDALVWCGAHGQEPVNEDAADVSRTLAQRAGEAGVIAAVDAAARAADDIAHNVTPCLAVEVMLLAFKEALCPASSR